MDNLLLYGLPILILVIGLLVMMALAMSLRVVVSTNDVHIVQRAKGAVSYGAGQAAGNTYYKWPAWMPMIGVRISLLPLSIFNILLKDYPAYDKGRVPFVIDIMAFFRITDSGKAASRVNSFVELQQQLQGILQSACRSILARSEIEEILEGRSTFGEMFTQEVDKNLQEWGLQSVKNIELMDIRDASDSKVIQNIMAKKKSLIERESRIAVAENQRAAKVAEIEATRAVQVQEQDALQQVGIRTASKDQEIGIAAQKAQQAVKGEERATMVKSMDVSQVETVRKAEIAREAGLVSADQLRQVAVIQADGIKQTSVINAEGERQRAIIAAEGKKQQTVLVAEGNLSQAQLGAKGIEAEGLARGAAETAVLMAPVTAQTALAKEIGANKEYQTYLITVRTIDKDEAIGKAQAAALEKADVKVIANTGQAVEGVKNVMDLFTAKGGTQLGAMVEALAQTPTGEAIVRRFNGNGETAHE